MRRPWSGDDGRRGSVTAEVRSTMVEHVMDQDASVGKGVTYEIQHGQRESLDSV